MTSKSNNLKSLDAITEFDEKPYKGYRVQTL